MANADLLPASVLRRKAVVYVRQSTPAQVQVNLESQRRQYELVDVARRRGFREVEVIDDDLGRSASGMVARPGFERLVAWLCRQPSDHRGREVRRVLAQQGGERLLEVAGGDAAQVEHRQQRIQAAGAPRPARHERRAEADAFAIVAGAAVADLHPRHRHRTDPGLDLTLGTMAVAHQTRSPVRQPQSLPRGQERLGL